MYDISLSNIKVDVIAIQETWSFYYPELVHLPGFQPIIFSGRSGMRGGGVGLYVREGLHFNRPNHLSTFHEKTFECLTVELQYPNRKIIISNIYRSPNPPPHLSMAEHMNQFLLTFNSHLEAINNLNKMSFVFLDSNINLHLIQSDPTALNYLNSIISNGFIQVITRSTRVQGLSHSLIDHVLINNNNFNENCSGTLLSDISDHFFNFYQLAIKTIRNS
jgi:exonuclease III